MTKDVFNCLIIGEIYSHGKNKLWYETIGHGKCVWFSLRFCSLTHIGFWNLTLEKVSSHSNPKEGHCQIMVKLPHNCTPANKVMLKIFKLTFSRTWTEKFQMYKLDLENAEEPDIKFPTFIGLYRKQENSRKTCASLTLWKPLTVWITTNWKIL